MSGPPAAGFAGNRAALNLYAYAITNLVLTKTAVGSPLAVTEFVRSESRPALQPI